MWQPPGAGNSNDNGGGQDKNGDDGLWKPPGAAGFQTAIHSYTVARARAVDFSAAHSSAGRN